MRRLLILCVLCLSITGAFALSSALASAHSAPSSHQASHKAHHARGRLHKGTKRHRRGNSGGWHITRTLRLSAQSTLSATALVNPAAAAATAPDPVLLGNQSVATTRDGGQGTSEAFGYTASVTGNATNISVYLDSTNGVRLGLYSDSFSKPGARLDQGRVTSNSAGWVTVPLSGGAQVTSGTRYWIAIAATSGRSTVAYRDAGNSGSSLDYSGSGVENPYSVSHQWSSNPASVYVGGTTSTPPPVAPADTALPAISGTAQQGDLLTASTGTWTGTAPISYSYQWQRQGTTNIASATGSSYTAVAADVGARLDVVVTATNAAGSSSATSLASPVVSATTPPPPAPTDMTLPVMSGTTTQGYALSTSNGSWTGSPTSFAYQWQDCNSSGSSCASVSGATSSSYMLAGGDVTHTIRVLVAATNTGGSTSASSAASAVVASPPPSLPANTALPVVTGTTTQGQPLAGTNGSWTGSPTGYAYQWRDCDASGNSCSNLSGATSSSYVLGSGDVGDTMRLVVTATNASGSTPATSNATAPVASSTSPTSCFGSPGGCGYPDPASGNVGPSSACSTLTPSGSVTASTSGQTIQNLNVTGTIQVSAPNVTIHNVCVTENGGAVLGSNAIKVTSTGTTISNSTLAGANSSTQSVEQAVTNFGGGTVTMNNDYVYNCGECLNTGSWTVSNSYLLNNGMYNTNDHLEVVYTSDATVNINHSVLLTPPGWNGSGSPNGGQAGILFGDTHGGSGGACDNHWTVTNSLLAGDGVLIYECGNASSAGSSSMDIANNRIARCLGSTHSDSQGYTECTDIPFQTGANTGRAGDGHGYFAVGGLKGTDLDTYCTGSGQAWTGNVWDDNGATIGC